MEANVLAIQHLRYGCELFAVKEASCNLCHGEDGVLEFVVKVATGPVIQRVKELEGVIDAEPWFEAAAVLPAQDLEIYEGRVIEQAAGYDYSRKENLSNFCYFAHESIEKLRIELHQVTEDWIDATVSGDTTVSGSNGTEPDAEISLRTRFRREKKLKRSFR